jgi:hypothetical protein
MSKKLKKLDTYSVWVRLETVGTFSECSLEDAINKAYASIKTDFGSMDLQDWEVFQVYDSNDNEVDPEHWEHLT